MDNITYVEFPVSSIKEGEKVAKLSGLKRDNLNKKYREEYAKINNNKQTPSENKNTTSILEEIEIVNASSNVTNTGARKLKVISLVKDKTSNYYKAHKKEEEVVVETPQEEVAVVQEEVKPPVAPPPVEETVKQEEVVVPEPSVEKTPSPSIDNTRMSRLDREEVSVPEVSLKREDVHEDRGSDIINTPSRFAMNENKVETNSSMYDELINDRRSTPESYDTIKKEELTRGGDPNLYNKLIHGGQEDEVSLQLQDAKNKLSTANEEKEKARMVNANLEAEVANVRAAIEKIKRERSEKVQRELNNTLNMLQTTKEEILSETRKYDNLQQELSELMRQRDTLLGGSYQEDTYSRSRV